MNYYTGKHKCDLDIKGRAVIPSAFRKVPPEILAGDLILSPSVEEDLCVEVYPEPEWESFIARIAGAENLGLGESRQLLAGLFGDADRTKVDRQNRLAISHPLREVLGVDGADENVTLLFVGAGSYFKIYLADDYAEQLEYRSEEKRGLMRKYLSGPSRPQNGGENGKG
ncbi:MAG TPA: hypothetical protein ENH10_01070 [Bacteroidetes bacterium]|nr:cell division protein MraZ [bacterium BMS3Bbin04]HDO64610.1 hypothetical protein [Bacteroidota bacterium]HEX03735.1 hypothetical protein [Bacteroidota bacterium]